MDWVEFMSENHFNYVADICLYSSKDLMVSWANPLVLEHMSNGIIYCQIMTVCQTLQTRSLLLNAVFILIYGDCCFMQMRKSPFTIIIIINSYCFCYQM